MRIKDYLSAKYEKKKPTTMLSCEARAFGIPYPLKTGWLIKFGDIEITSDMAARLRKGLDASGKNTAATGLEVLDKAWLELKNTPDANSPEFLQSKAWKRVRLQALNKHGRKCQCCGSSPATGAVLNVDHVLPRRLFPQLALQLDNLQVLYADCNEGKGNWDMTDARPASATNMHDGE